MSIAPLRRATTALASAALVAAPFVAVVPASAAPAPDEAATAAVDWLAGELEAGDGTISGTFGPSWGLTADAVLALQSAGRSDDPVLDQAIPALATAADDYATGIAYGSDFEAAGETAKLMLVSQGQGLGATLGRDDLDLEQVLRGTLRDDGLFEGPNDDTNGFDQALALLALAGTDAGVPAGGAEFLADRQCDDGGFPAFYFAPCASGDADTDNTAMAVQALLAAGGHDDAVSDAVAWLTDRAEDDGSFPGSASTPTPNANSTGLAAQALDAAGGQDAAVAPAQDFLASLQRRGGSDPGAIAYDVARRDATAGGIDDRDQFQRATAHAVLGLTGASLAEAAAAGGSSVPPAEEPPGEEPPAEESPGVEPPAGGPVGDQPPSGQPVEDEPSARPTIATRPGTTDVEHTAAVLAAAAWQSGGLVNGERVVQVLDGTTFPNVGGTVDVALSFLATDTQPEALARVIGYLDAQAANYTQGAEFVGDGEFDEKEGAAYAGATAKLALTVALADGDPRDVAGIDLIEQLQRLEDGSGRYRDDSSYGDFSNLLGQSFGILALHQADDVDPTVASVTTLVGAQCPDGGFPEQFPTDATCASDPDTTGLVLQALAAVETGGGAAGGAAGTVADVAVEWLAGQRTPDGAWEGPGGENTNSTGYAVMGLAAQSEDVSTSRTWLEGVQDDAGGLPINAGGDADPFATAQAMVALAGGFFADPAVTVPETTTATPSSTTVTGGPATAPGAANLSPTSGPESTSGALANALPRTGTEVAALVAVALLLLGLGTAATLAARRSRGAHQ